MMLKVVCVAKVVIIGKWSEFSESLMQMMLYVVLLLNDENKDVMLVTVVWCLLL